MFINHTSLTKLPYSDPTPNKTFWGGIRDKVRYWLSYLFPLPVTRTRSATNPYLQVVYEKGEYKLLSSNCIYSYGLRYTSFAHAFKTLNIGQRSVNRVLMLGFGLGSAVKILDQYQSHYQVTGVEIDPKVIKLAKQFLTPEQLTYVNFVEADAESFVKNTDQKYDLIALDIFLDKKVPEKFEQEAFLKQLKTCLQAGGLLLYNRLADESTNLFFNSIFKAVFPNAKKLPINGNQVLVYEKES